MTFQGLADGSISIHTFFRAKKQAEFMEWVQGKITEAGSKKDEVEYFD